VPEAASIPHHAATDPSNDACQPLVDSLFIAPRLCHRVLSARQHSPSGLLELSAAHTAAQTWLARTAHLTLLSLVRPILSSFVRAPLRRCRRPPFPPNRPPDPLPRIMSNSEPSNQGNGFQNRTQTHLHPPSSGTRPASGASATSQSGLIERSSLDNVSESRTKSGSVSSNAHTANSSRRPSSAAKPSIRTIPREYTYTIEIGGHHWSGSVGP